MKKTIIIILSILLITLFVKGFVMADIIEHPRYATLNTLVDALINKITLAQADYFAENGKYFQGLPVPSTLLDGLEDVNVVWTIKPGDQDESYKDFDPTTFQAQFKIPFNIRIDVYEHLTAWGWKLRIDLYSDGLGPDQFGFDGDHWVYIHNHGPVGVPPHPGAYDVWYIETPVP